MPHTIGTGTPPTVLKSGELCSLRVAALPYNQAGGIWQREVVCAYTRRLQLRNRRIWQLILGRWSRAPDHLYCDDPGVVLFDDLQNFVHRSDAFVYLVCSTGFACRKAALYVVNCVAVVDLDLRVPGSGQTLQFHAVRIVFSANESIVCASWDRILVAVEARVCGF